MGKSKPTLKPSTRKETSPLLRSGHVNLGSYASDNGSELKYGSRWSSYRKACARRPLPKKKNLLLLLFVYFIESIAFYCATKSIRELLFKDESKQAWESFIFSLINNSLGRIFYPVAGVLADAFFGRYKVIETGLWLVSLGVGCICLNLSIIDGVSHSIGRVFLPTVCIILIALGTACVEVNTISFGVDQLPQGCTSDTISSFFFWYNFTRNAGFFVGILLNLILQHVHLFTIDENLYYSDLLKDLINESNIHYTTLIVTLVAAATIVCGLLLHMFKRYWYFEISRRDNPIKTILNVTWYSLTVKRHAPVYRRSFRYGEARQPRMELAKIEYDGIFEAEVVENVKSFYQILVLILSLGGFLASNSAASSVLTSQFEDKKLTSNLGPTYSYISSYLNQLVNALTIIVFLPIFNHVLLPFFPRLNMSLKLRLAIGLALNVVAILLAVLLQGTAEHTDGGVTYEKKLWLLLPAVVLSIGETITSVASLEFIYAQAPEAMKGLLTGLFYFMFGVFSGISNIVFYFFPTDRQERDKVNYILWLYVLLALVAALGCLLYGIVICFYRNRRRPGTDEDVLERTLTAQKVFFNTSNNDSVHN